MKKLFALMFAALLAICSYANSDLLEGISLEQIDLNIPQGDGFPISNKSHIYNTIEATINLKMVNLDELNADYPAETRYWANSRAWERWQKNNSGRYIRHDAEGNEIFTEADEERYNDAVNEFIRNYEKGLTDKLDDAIRGAKLATTECQMVRISSYWLVGFSSCLPSYIRKNPGVLSGMEEVYRLFVVPDPEEDYNTIYLLNDLEIDGVNISNTKVFVGKGLLLIHLNANEVNAMKNLSARQANLISADRILTEFYVKKKELGNVKLEGTELERTSFLEGPYEASGTPIFGEDQEYREYLVGFNSASYEDFTRGYANKFTPKSGNKYQIITQEMTEFIEGTIFAATKDESGKSGELDEVQRLK